MKHAFRATLVAAACLFWACGSVSAQVPSTAAYPDPGSSVTQVYVPAPVTVVPSGYAYSYAPAYAYPAPLYYPAPYAGPAVSVAVGVGGWGPGYWHGGYWGPRYYHRRW
jgi:hypothetical protein